MEKRSQVIALYRFIQRKIVKDIEISQSTVSRILKHYAHYETVVSKRKDKCGRKPKTSPKDDRKLIRESKTNPRLTCIELQNIMEQSGCSIYPQ